jgi:hypothetical protein
MLLLHSLCCDHPTAQKRARSMMRKLSSLPQVCHAVVVDFRLRRETGWRVRATPSDLLLATKGC